MTALKRASTGVLSLFSDGYDSFTNKKHKEAKIITCSKSNQLLHCTSTCMYNVLNISPIQGSPYLFIKVPIFF